MKLIKLLLITIVTTAQILAADVPEKVLGDFFAAIDKGDKKTALAFTKQFPDTPVQYVEEKVSHLIESARKSKTPIVIITSKTLTELAVVVINERPSAPDVKNIDPVYLIKDGGEWKVTINLKFDTTALKISDTVRTEYQELKAWYRAKEQELKDK
jgi:hypothetical protein